jgi:hypothetical protein
MEHQFETDVLRSKLAKLPDLEKLVAKLYTYSVKHKVKAIYFENVSLIKMREFKQLQGHMKALADTVSSLRDKVKDFKSMRLKTLLTDDEKGGLFPS